MVSSNINDGILCWFANSGEIVIFALGGADDYMILHIERDFFVIIDGHEDGIVIREGAVLDDVLEGDDQLLLIVFNCSLIKNGFISASDLRTILAPTNDTDGSKQFYDVQINWSDKKLVSIGICAIWTNCWLSAGGIVYNVCGGAQFDLVRITLMSLSTQSTMVIY